MGSGPSGPRVRFAPSPTGYLHVGNARTALFNWLFARRSGGTFVLRIEDTDVERSRPELAEAIVSGLSWLGMEPDESPLRQSERTRRYEELVDVLWSAGHLYACECTREEVLARTKDNAIPGYDAYCRDRGLARGPGRALRFRSPLHGTTVVHDLIRGDVEFPHQAIEDFVCVKANGQPLFILANAIDDRDTKISHVIRGEDLLPSTPKGLLIWAALDETTSKVSLPDFAHLPMLVNEQRKKLSKRRDQVAVESYRNQGFLPEAFRNYLALLGWSPKGDKEKVPLETLVQEFDLADVHHAPAFFDIAKLKHMNGEYIRDLSTTAFMQASLPWLEPQETGSWAPPTEPPWPRERFDKEVYEVMAPVVQERVSVLGDVAAMVAFLFMTEPTMDAPSWEKVVANPLSHAILAAAEAVFADCQWSIQAIEAATRSITTEAGTNLSKGQAPIRVALTGRSAGPPLFESILALGREVVLARLGRARARLGLV
ncbi:MAG: glutamate--tRNA ligase [Acidimicrobiales bacterium]